MPVTDEAGLRAALAQATGDVEITLANSIELAAPLELDTGAKVMFVAGSEVKLTVQGPHRHFVIKASGTTLGFSNVVLDGGGLGGGIAVHNAQNVALQNAQIQNCRAKAGGGVLLNASTVLLHDTTIEKNAAYVEQFAGEGEGGGVYVSADSGLAFGGSVRIDGNTAQITGGGVHVANNNPNTLHIPTGVSISHNKSTQNGGGLYMGDNTNTLVEGGKIEYNESNFDGGGFYIGQAAKLVTQGGESSISHNKAIGGGGISGSYAVNGVSGIITGTSYVELLGGKVSHNKAREVDGIDRYNSGGGVSAYSVLVDGAHVDENRTQHGYAATVNCAHFTIKSGTVNQNFLEKGYTILNYVPGTTISCVTFTMENGEINNNDYGALNSKYNFNTGKPTGSPQDLYGTVAVVVNRIPDITQDTAVSNVTINGGSISNNRAQNGGALALTRNPSDTNSYNTTDIPDLFKKAALTSPRAHSTTIPAPKQALALPAAAPLSIWIAGPPPSVAAQA